MSASDYDRRLDHDYDAAAARGAQRNHPQLQHALLGPGGLSAMAQSEELVALQMKADAGVAEPEGVHEIAAEGVAGSGGPVPHGEQIQAAFGHHDISGVRAHVGGAAEQAAMLMNAQAYATGQEVAFAREPDLHTAAHEAAHVVQQRGGVSLKGGVGQAGDAHERHADAVADRVVQGESAVGLLDAYASGGGGAAVQRRAAEEAGGGPGLAVFFQGPEQVTQGGFSHRCNTATYMHPYASPDAEWEDVDETLHLVADHARPFLDDQNFYFRLTYQRNGNGIRNAKVVALVDQSSMMIGSSFSGAWSGQMHSPPGDPVCQIVFDITGNWDSFGLGEVSWWGQLVLSGDTSTDHALTINAERGKVRAG